MSDDGVIPYAGRDQNQGEYAFECACGAVNWVAAGQAGLSVRCPACQGEQVVPQLSQLQSIYAPWRLGKRDAGGNASANNGFSIIGLHTGPIIDARINEQALVHFISAVVRVLATFPINRRELKNTRLSLAILPNRELLLEVIGPQRAETVGRLKDLRERIESLRCPPVRGGPVAFVIFSGKPWLDDEYPHPPFSSLLRKFRGNSLDELIYEAAELTPDVSPQPVAASAGGDSLDEMIRPLTETSWWKRAAGWFARTLGLRPTEKPPTSNADHREEATIETLSAAIAREPDAAMNYLLRGELYCGNEMYEQAMADYSAAIARDESLAITWMRRASCYLHLSEYQPALVDLSAALRHDPTLTSAWVLRAQVYQSLEAWNAAEDDLTSALKLSPDDARLYHYRAQTRACQQRLAEAMADVDSAIDGDPHDDGHYALRGALRKRIAENVEQLEQALDDFVTAATISNDAHHHLACGDLLLRLSRPQQAFEAAEKALQCEAGDASALGLRGIAASILDAPSADVIRDCTAAIEGHCETAMIYACRGEAYLRERSLHAALEDFSKAIQLDPEMPTAFNCRGIIRADLDMDELARDDFDRAIELAPTWSPPLLNRAEWHRQHEDYESAIEDCDQVLNEDPDDAKARVIRGICRLEQEQFDAAQQDFDEAVAHAPEWPQTWCERGKFWLSRGELETARADLDRAVTLDPSHLEALMQRSTVLVNLNELDAALADANRLIELSPDLVQAYAGRASIWLMLGQPDKARQDTDKVIEEHPEAAEELRVRHLLLQASMHMRNEKYGDAISRAEEVLKSYPDCFPARRLRAVAYWYSEQFVEAVDEYSWLMENDEESAGYFGYRGQVWTELGEFDRALADLDRAAELVSGIPGSETLAAYVRSGRGLALAGLDRTAEGIAELGKSIEERPQNAWVQFNLGLVYFRIGESAKAAACFRLALELSDPRLTPRKRDRARAFLAKME